MRVKELPFFKLHAQQAALVERVLQHLLYSTALALLTKEAVEHAQRPWADASSDFKTINQLCVCVCVCVYV